MCVNLGNWSMFLHMSLNHIIRIYNVTILMYVWIESSVTRPQNQIGAKPESSIIVKKLGR